MKIFKFLCSLLITVVVNAEINTTTETCSLESSQAFGYTGDVSGKRINTKEEYTYFCTKATTQRGECTDWKIEIETLNINYLEPAKIYFETEDYSGSMGAMLSITQAYDKINGLWSGWHGLCQTGMDDGNFDWMSDPYVLAGYAMSAYGASTGAETAAANEAANQAGNQVVNQATQTVADKAAQEAASQYARQQVVNYSLCAARAGLDISKMVEEYEDDGEPCDPIDEFCEEDKAGEIDSEIFTLPENKYNDMLSSNPDMAKYLKVLKGEGTGIVTVKVINPGIDSSPDMQAYKDEMKKLKEMMLAVRAVVTSVQLTVCLVRNSAGGGGSETADFTSPQNLAVTAISMYNPLVGIALDVAINTFASLQPINTCSDEDDAKAKGARHIATLKAKALGQCHFVESIDSGSSLKMNKRTRYRFCCYDDKITRILVEQSKAQLAKDWQHCTDITLKELQFLNFTACDPNGLDSSGKDGSKMNAYASQSERFTSYQYLNKCIDTREYMAYMMETFGGEDMLLDTSDIEKTLEDLK